MADSIGEMQHIRSSGEMNQWVSDSCGSWSRENFHNQCSISLRLEIYQSSNEIILSMLCQSLQIFQGQECIHEN